MGQKESFCYRIAARTEAAGKYDPHAPREGNEDSFAIIPNVGDMETTASFDTITAMPEKGVLLVVADGMGGHNAGEVASQMAVNTVREMFAPTVVSEKVFSSKESRAKYLEKMVKQADRNIRADADANPDRIGMGSTIIIAWIVGNELTVTWCGDSRAYRYHPDKGLEMLSEDHSMVQDMVRKKQLKYEETFSHPQGNIITHCLGGGDKGNAEAESRQFALEDGDLIMLCSDGLSGVLFDDGRLRSNGEPYSEENIQEILSRKRDCLKDTLTCLFDAARRCDWYDNVTAVLLEFKTGNVEQGCEGTLSGSVHQQQEKKKRWCNSRRLLFIATAILIVVLVSLAGIFGSGHGGRLEADGQEDPSDSIVQDTIHEDAPTTEDSADAEPTATDSSEGEGGEYGSRKKGGGHNRLVSKEETSKAPTTNNPPEEGADTTELTPIS